MNSHCLFDPVYKVIQLTTLEREIINTPVFQRLHNIKQLGLAHLVFPCANYSRFSHSVGVCHIVGRMFEILQSQNARLDGRKISNTLAAKYRIAALLHDIGHYPFSHAMEKSIKKYYENYSPLTAKKYLSHERVGQSILRKNKLLGKLLKETKLNPEEISKIFLREVPDTLARLINSDLDADRIDYLLRTAYHTGFPYGAVDLESILNQLRLDKKVGVCYSKRGERTVEHLLLSRYFDYNQIVFDRTVVAFELVLEQLIMKLIENNKINCTEYDIRKMIEKREWCLFNDDLIISKLREFKKCTKDGVWRLKADSILKRNPPKLVAELEYIGNTKLDRHLFVSYCESIKSGIKRWSKQFGIDKRLWLTWEMGNMSVIDIESKIPLSEVLAEISDETRAKLEKSVWIQDSSGKNVKPIVELPYSLMKLLEGCALYSIRIYVLFSDRTLDAAFKQGKTKQDLAEEINKVIKDDLKKLPWL